MRVRRSQWLTWGRRSKCSQGTDRRAASRAMRAAYGKMPPGKLSIIAFRAARGGRRRVARAGRLMPACGGRAGALAEAGLLAAGGARGARADRPGITRRSRGGAHADSRERRSSPAPSHAFRDTGGSTRARAFAQAGFRGAATRRTEPAGRCAAKPWASIAPVVTGRRSADPPVPFPPARSARRENRAAPARAAPCSACCDRSRAAARRGAASRATAP